MSPTDAGDGWLTSKMAENSKLSPTLAQKAEIKLNTMPYVKIKLFMQVFVVQTVQIDKI